MLEEPVGIDEPKVEQGAKGRPFGFGDMDLVLPVRVRIAVFGSDIVVAGEDQPGMAAHFLAKPGGEASSQRSL